MYRNPGESPVIYNQTDRQRDVQLTWSETAVTQNRQPTNFLFRILLTDSTDHNAYDVSYVSICPFIAQQLYHFTPRCTWDLIDCGSGSTLVVSWLSFVVSTRQSHFIPGHISLAENCGDCVPWMAFSKYHDTWSEIMHMCGWSLTWS